MTHIKIHSKEAVNIILNKAYWMESHFFYYLQERGGLADPREVEIRTEADVDHAVSNLNKEIYMRNLKKVQDLTPTKEPVEIKYWEAAQIIEERTNPSRVVIYKGDDIGDGLMEITSLESLHDEHTNQGCNLYELPARTNAEVQQDSAISLIREELESYIDPSDIDLKEFAQDLLNIVKGVYKIED